MIERFGGMVCQLRVQRWLIVISLLAGSAAHAAGLAAPSDGADINGASPKTAPANGLWASACFLIFACRNPAATKSPPAAAAVPRQVTAADRVEALYNGSAVGTDAQGDEGCKAAQNAEEQLLSDFLGSFQNPQKNAANQTAWDQEQDQLISDSLKYAGDKTLDAAAMYWGETRLNLPVTSPEEIIAQADTMAASDRAGEREFDQYMANYLAARFDTLNRLTGQFQTASDDMEGRHLPLGLADLQAELRFDEVARTMGKPRSPAP
jgi:hypothetical protein